MPAMDTIRLPHLADHPLTVGLFENVANAAFLRKQLLDGNPDFEYAFLDAAALVSKNQVLAACFRAISDSINGQMKSRNVHSEIVFCLSANNNIAESFRRFGISDSSTHIVAIKIDGDAAQVEEHLRQCVDGTCALLTDDALKQLSEPSRVKKAYRIDAAKEGLPTTEAFVLGSIALRGS